MQAKLVSIFAILTLQLTIRSFIILKVERTNHEIFNTHIKHNPYIAIYHLKDHKISEMLLKHTKKLNKEFPNMALFTVQCDKENELFCNRLKKGTYPRVVMKRFGAVKHFNGELAYEDILYSLKKAYKAPLKELKQPSDLDSLRRWMYIDYAVVIYKGKLDKKSRRIFKRLSFKHQNILHFYHTSDDEIFKLMNMSKEQDGIYLKQYDNNELIYYDPEKKQPFIDFIRENRFKQLETLTPILWSTLQKYKKKSFVFLFSDKCTQKDEYVLQETYSFNQDNTQEFYKVVKEGYTQLYADLTKLFGVPDKCSFVIIKRKDDFGWKKFLYQKKLTRLSVSDFLNKYKNNKLRELKKSKQIKSLEFGELSFKNFQKTLDKKDVPAFVLFYNEETKGDPQYLEFLHEIPKENPLYNLYKFNLSFNETPGITIGKLPQIMFFNPEQRDKPVKYDGALTQDDFIEKVRPHLASKQEADSG